MKPFVKRQKNEAAPMPRRSVKQCNCPTIRFVVPKSDEAQAADIVFRVRDLLVEQRTQIINALRNHLAEFGIVAVKGSARVPHLAQAVEDPEEPIPELVRPIRRC
ncbi:hypothetical protein [Microvirga guangxiensis]|uniref:Transposase n=1 Tax=Microvirga guangxiensis TaxID=549386 RepID=A0A1G5L0M9_9HYPH|nr:hypothetical protein [Microvirga guangxiensis]SCZ05981.1 hypothetical protein SAMN02927923_03754 [Microvirga guangxiensis]